MTPEDRNIVAARLAGIRVAVVQPGEQDIDAKYLPLDGEYPCVLVWPEGNAWYFENADTSGHMTEVPWRPDRDANQAIMLADRLFESRKWRFEALRRERGWTVTVHMLVGTDEACEVLAYAMPPTTFAAAVVAAACAAGEATR